MERSGERKVRFTSTSRELDPVLGDVGLVGEDLEPTGVGEDRQVRPSSDGPRRACRRASHPAAGTGGGVGQMIWVGVAQVIRGQTPERALGADRHEDGARRHGRGGASQRAPGRRLVGGCGVGGEVHEGAVSPRPGRARPTHSCNGGEWRVHHCAIPSGYPGPPSRDVPEPCRLPVAHAPASCTTPPGMQLSEHYTVEGLVRLSEGRMFCLANDDRPDRHSGSAGSAEATKRPARPPVRELWCRLVAASLPRVGSLGSGWLRALRPVLRAPHRAPRLRTAGGHVLPRPGAVPVTPWTGEAPPRGRAARAGARHGHGAARHGDARLPARPGGPPQPAHPRQLPRPRWVASSCSTPTSEA